MKVAVSTLVVAMMAVGVASGAHDDASVLITPRHHQKLQHLVKRAFSGDATSYDVETGNPGACGQMFSRSDYVVAINQPQYGSLNQKSSWCGKTITISANGKSAQARVMDACPTGGGNCGYGSLDMSESLFRFFNPLSVGKFPITWTLGGGGGNVVDDVVSAVTGKKKNNDNDNNDWEEEQRKKKAEAAQRKKEQEEAQAAREAQEAKEAQKAKEAQEAADRKEAVASSSSAAAAAASKSASRAAAQAEKSASAARASSASVASVTRAAASRYEARVSASASRAATAVSTGNLDKFDQLFEGLNNMVQNQAS